MARHGLGGFSGMKLERRRPSKRETTSRSFAIVRNWKSNVEVSSTSTTATAPNVQQSAEKDMTSHVGEVCSPQYPKQTWPLVQQPETMGDPKSPLPLKGDAIKATNPPLPESPLNSLQSDSPKELSPVLSSLTPPPTVNDMANISISVDQTLTSQMLQSASPTETTSEDMIANQDYKASKVKRQRLQEKPQMPSKEHQPKRQLQSRKRNQQAMSTSDDTEQDTQHTELDSYTSNRFVRIYNANQGRKVSVKDITGLDVALTAIEKEALLYRDELKSDLERRCIKDFFIQVRKSFGESIDMQKEHKGIKSDLRKAKSQLNKYKSELLEVQKKRTKLKGRLEKLGKDQKESNQNDKDSQEIDSFVEEMKKIQKSCTMRTPYNTKIQCHSTIPNLPSVMCQMQALLISMTTLQSRNAALEQWLNTK